jgi:hypothetical protein
MAEWVCGGRTPEEERHLRECAQCGAEIARLKSALGHFRESVRGWSEERSEAALQRVRAAAPLRRGPARVWFRWPVLAAAALVLSVAPVYKTVHDRQRAAQALADAQLLEQVEREVSETVPTPMEPLAQLVSWESASQDSSQSSSPSSSQNSSQNGDVR